MDDGRDGRGPATLEFALPCVFCRRCAVGSCLWSWPPRRRAAPADLPGHRARASSSPARRSPTSWPPRPEAAMTPMAASCPSTSGSISGAGRVVVKNVPGGGHIVGTNELYHARPDGLTLGTFNSGLIYAQLLQRRGLQARLDRLSWVGKAGGEPRLLVTSTQSGFRSLADIRGLRPPAAHRRRRHRHRRLHRRDAAGRGRWPADPRSARARDARLAAQHDARRHGGPVHLGELEPAADRRRLRPRRHARRLRGGRGRGRARGRRSGDARRTARGSWR